MSFQGWRTVLDYAAGRGFADDDIRWTCWMDPGTTTGLAFIAYAPADREADLRGRFQAAGMLWPGVDPDFVEATVLAVHAELLTGDEIHQARTALSRVRAAGRTYAGPGIDLDEDTLGIGAGIGAESFLLHRSETSEELLSPVRIRSMFAYGLDEEFGIPMRSQSPSDAKNTFDDARLERQNLRLGGPDHLRDALRHCLLAIRKSG